MTALARKQETGPTAEQTESRRTHERVRQYWQNVKEQRQYPQESEIDPQEIEDAWEYCFLVDMREGSVDQGFHYDYMGAKLIEAYGMNMTSLQRCDPRTEPHIASMLRHFDEVVESGEAAMDESEFRNVRGMHIKYRCCLLPLGKDKVEFILGCMRWKAC